MVLAVMLVIRHRTPRLAAAFVLAFSALTMWQDSALEVLPSHQGLALSLVAVLSVIGCSRLACVGGALEAARTAAARWWIVPVGRLLGLILLLLPVALGVGTALVVGRVGSVSLPVFAMAALLLATALGSLILSVTPFAGASGAAGVGFILALAGGIRPSAISLVLDQLPLIRAPVVLLWNHLPLLWRAHSWLTAGEPSFILHSLVWIAIGVAVTAYTLSVRYRTG